MNPQTAVGAVVVLVWAASSLATFIDRTYHPPDGINSVMMLVAGFFFATGMRKTDDGSNGDEGR
jgi:predicted tellurium resistance membrane protein TerC